MLSRRTFLHYAALPLAAPLLGRTQAYAVETDMIMTVQGPIQAEAMGLTLIHEHILVDFTGAAGYGPNRWNDDAVVEKVLPYLTAVKTAGCQTFIDCTPAYLGRDITLLQTLSMRSGLHIITNTGYYGGSDNKYLPQHAFTETEDMLAARWIKEYTHGIDGTAAKPGFIKTSVNNSSLSAISQKLIRAAARCHRATGLTIASHTGPAVPAFEAMDILREEGVANQAFIWVHAQDEKDWSRYVTAARAGAWVSLDGVSDDNISEYTERLSLLKKEHCLKNVLLSHDAGWYEPAKAGGGTIRPYTTLFLKLIPNLRNNGFTEQDIIQLLRRNPADAFRIRIRRKD